MAPMTPNIRRFVIVLLAAWAGVSAWSAFTDGAWMRWLLVLFLVGCISFLRRSSDSVAATLLPPAAMALSFGLDALQREDLAVASACLILFFGLLAGVVKQIAPE